MKIPDSFQRSRIEEALSARLELLGGGASGAATYRVYGLAEPCVLKVIEAGSPDYLRTRGQREICFYRQLAVHVPLRTPQVMASVLEESGYCALLIAAYSPIASANELNMTQFVEVAEQLAGFHAVHWNRTDLLGGFPWIEQPKIVDLSQAAHHAAQCWRKLGQQSQFRELLTGLRLRQIEAALGEISATPEYGVKTAMTLCHGDCHLENVLRDPDGCLVWADWQEVRVGHGPSDLSFLIQRAEANGAKIAHHVLIGAYCKALEAAGIRNVDQGEIEHALHESERRTRLLFWPDYMMETTAEAMVHHLERIFLNR